MPVAAAAPVAEAGGAASDLTAAREALHRLTLNLALAEHEGCGFAAGRLETLFAELDRAAQALDAAPAPAAPPAAPATPAERVLVVAEGGPERELLSSLLTRWGVNVQAVDVGAAEVLLRDDSAPRPDLVLVDLPAVGHADATDDTADALLRLRAAAAGGAFPVRLLAVGASAAAAPLADEFLVKPINPRALAAHLRAAELAA